jgi:hypothetical protein
MVLAIAFLLGRSSSKVFALAGQAIAPSTLLGSFRPMLAAAHGAAQGCELDRQG